MPMDLLLRCQCGHVRGVAREVSPTSGLRFVCYCTDCQAFARILERQDVLDAAGGMDIFQMAPGHVTLTVGVDALRCISFSNKVLRWYADCCKTPIANTAADPRFPVVALIHTFIDSDAVGCSRDDAFGPPLCRIYERSATGPLPPDAPPPHRLKSSPAAQRKFSAGGGAGSAGRTRSSTSTQTRRSLRRAGKNDADFCNR